MARLDSSVFPALSESAVAKLHSRNIFTVYDFMLQSCNDLMKKTDLTFKEIEDIRESFFKSFGGEIVNPLEIYNQELQDVIPTGIKNLDALLAGGLHCRKIYEICGSSSAGKSQLCHWISTYSTLNASTEVHYIDGSRNFCVSRIQMMLEAKNCSDSDVAKVMSNIKVHQIHKINDVFTIFHHLSKKPLEGESKSMKKIVIVDSLSVLCAIVPNKELNSILSNFASVCRYFVNHYSAVVIIVNTIRSEGGVFEAEADKTSNFSIKPSLGNYWLCVPNIRLLIMNLENKRREISVWKSCQLKDGRSCFLHFRDEGIFDN